MRRLLIAALAATALAPNIASAQSGEIRRGQDEVRQGREEVQRDLRRGDYREAREDRREVREDRRELREDWREYRQRNRNVYRQGRYSGPRGYRYAPVRIGYQFAPTYYGQRYRVSNYARYRLPRPGYNRRYIRYGNDVILINVRNGRVIQVYRNFFW